MHVGTAVGGTIALPLGRTQQMPVVHLQDAVQGRDNQEGPELQLFMSLHSNCMTIARSPHN